jgi:hypothetical protein
MMVRAVCLLIGVTLASACSVRVNQIDTLRRLIPSIAGLSADRSVLEQYEWSFEFGESRFAVYPVEAQGRNVVFASGFGLRLTWDGESIIIIDQMPGAFGRFESGVEGGERWYAVPGQSVVRAECSPVRQWRLTVDRHGWRQECVAQRDGIDVATQHLVEFDQNNQIRQIETTVVPGMSPLRIRRLR